MIAPVISIVIPVYNAADYIIDCLNSIEQQTFSQYEVILVNDGSTDNSEQLIRSFIEQTGSDRYRFLSKENGGVSSARNFGIDQACGEWITFIDSDDWVDPPFLANMAEAVAAHPAQFCMSGFRKYFEDTKAFRDSVSPAFAYGATAEMLSSVFYPAPVARLFSTELLRRHNLRFDERIRLGEDRSFNFDYLRFADTCLIVEGNHYVYRLREGSITHGNVRPSQKRHLFEAVQRFYAAFDGIDATIRASHHLAHNMLDSLLADVINTVLDRDAKGFLALVRSPAAVGLLKNYKHKSAPTKEKLLVFLLKNRLYLFAKWIIRFYYSERTYRALRRLFGATR